MNSGQKVIVCVAIGAVMVVLGFAARAWWWETPGSSGGWFNYAPNNGVVYSFDGPDGSLILTQAATWIGLVLVWSAACLFIMRTRRTEAVADATQPPPAPPGS